MGARRWSQRGIVQGDGVMNSQRKSDLQGFPSCSIICIHDDPGITISKLMSPFTRGDNPLMSMRLYFAALCSRNVRDCVRVYHIVSVSKVLNRQNSHVSRSRVTGNNNLARLQCTLNINGLIDA